MKYTSELFIILISIFTFGIYGLYWYFSRRKNISGLVDGMKFPDVGLAVYVIGWVLLFFVSPEDSEISENAADFSGVAYLVIWAGAVWMCFSIKKILNEYAAKNCNDEAVFKVISSSDVALFFLGYICLQFQINKMIKAEIFAPAL